MAGSLTVRFSELQGYDINIDADTIRFMATTPKGSYWADVVVEGPRSMRKDRERFKALAIEYIRAGALPCEITLEDVEQ